MSDERGVLKPCPFCGGNAWERVEGGSLLIACHRCGAGIARALVPPAEWEKVPPLAREAWNRRIEPIGAAPDAGWTWDDGSRWELGDAMAGDADPRSEVVNGQMVPGFITLRIVAADGSSQQFTYEREALVPDAGEKKFPRPDCGRCAGNRVDCPEAFGVPSPWPCPHAGRGDAGEVERLIEWADKAHDALEYHAPNHPCVDEYHEVRARALREGGGA